MSMRILVIKLRHHGDMLLLTPVINSLRQCYSDASIDVLLYEETKDILSANTAIQKIYGIQRHRKQGGLIKHIRSEWQLLHTLRQRHYQLVLNLADQWHSAIISAFTGAKTRIGFDFSKRRGLLWKHCHTQLVSTEKHQHQHTVEQNLSILTPLALTCHNTTVTMSYTRQDQQHCQQRLPPGWQDNYIVIQPTSRWYFKSWPESQVSEVIDALCNKEYNIVLSAGSDEQENRMIHNIMTQVSQTRLISVAGELTLRQLAALIDNARLFIGVDSVPMHMAAALKTPSVVLFGPSKRTFWHPWQAPAEVIWAGDYGVLPDPDEINTNTRQRYLDLIPAQTVINAALRMLA